MHQNGRSLKLHNLYDVIAIALLNCFVLPVRSNHVTVFCHMIHHCLRSNSSLESSERELEHLSCYCRNCKKHLRIVFREHAYSATGNSRVHYLKSGYVIQLIAFWWDTACNGLFHLSRVPVAIRLPWNKNFVLPPLGQTVVHGELQKFY